ncbi:hypothetical protein D3C85_1452240 [compost metagenome]
MLGRRDQGLHLGFDGDVAQLAVNGLQPGLDLEALDRLFQAAWVYIGNHQRAATFFGAAFGCGKTDAGACCRGDEYGLAGQQLVAGHIGRGLSHDENLRRKTQCQ